MISAPTRGLDVDGKAAQSAPGGEPGPILMVSSWWPTEDDPHACPFVIDHVRALQGVGDVVCWPVGGGLRQVRGALLDEGVGVGRVVARHPRVPARFATQPMATRLLEALGGLHSRTIVPPIPRIVLLQSVSYAGPYALGLARALGCPLVYVEHWSAVGLRSLSARETVLLRRVLSASSRVLAVSQFLASAMEDMGGLEPGSVGVVENVVDRSVFAPTRPPQHEGTRIVHVADFRPVKDHDLLVDALLRIGPDELDRLDLRFVLVGDGPERTRVQQRVAGDSRISARVRFTGKLTRQEVAREMAAANWTLLTSRIETSSCVARESLSLGRPVIAPRVGALPEVLHQGDGVLYERSVAGLVPALFEAASNRDYGSWESRAAAAAARFAPEVLTQSYRFLLADVLAP